MNNLDLLTERNDQIKLFCYSVFFWSVLFGVLNEKLIYTNIPRRNQVDINNRIVSILHGQVSLWTSLYLLLCKKCQKHLVETPIYTQKNTKQMSLIMIGSAGYFTYDLIVCLYYKLYDFWLVLHHFASITALSMAIISQYSGCVSITALLYAEIPNFPMHLRIMLYDCGLKHTKLYELTELIYFLLYVIFRGAVSIPLLIYIWKDINSPVTIKLVGSILYLQAVYYLFEYQLSNNIEQLKYQEEKLSSTGREQKREYSIIGYQLILDQLNCLIQEMKRKTQLYETIQKLQNLNFKSILTMKTSFNPWSCKPVQQKVVNPSQNFGMFYNTLKDKYDGTSLMQQVKHHDEMKIYQQNIIFSEEIMDQKILLLHMLKDQQYGSIINPEQMKQNIKFLQEALEICNQVEDAYKKSWKINLNENEYQDYVLTETTIQVEIPSEFRVQFFEKLSDLYKNDTLKVQNVEGQLLQLKKKLKQIQEQIPELEQ